MRETLKDGKFALGFFAGFATSIFVWLGIGHTGIETNLISGIIGTIVGALIAGIAPLVQTLTHTHEIRQKSDAELLLDSFQKFDDLFDSLVSCRRTADEYRPVLDKVDCEYYDENGFALARQQPISHEKWKNIRLVKNFYRSRFNLIGKGVFSDEALVYSMDRYGVELMRSVKALDVLRFYEVRIDAFDRGEGKKLAFENQFANDFVWYDKLYDFLEKKGAKFVRD